MSRSTPNRANRCAQCLLPGHLCLCAELPRVETRTELLILQHVCERWQRSNTAVLAARALANSRLLTYAAPDEPFDRGLLSQPDTWLLFPDGPPAPKDAPPPSRLVVLDGSWAQTRRMTQRIPELLTMPRLVLSAPAAGRQRLRKPSHPSGMSTLEAIAHAITQLEGDAVGEPLHRLDALRVRRIVECTEPPDLTERG